MQFAKFVSMILIILFLFFVFSYGGWIVGRFIGDLLFPTEKEKSYTFIDKSVHHHYHEHKKISIIDEDTKESIFELRKN